jgi:putative transposase
MWCNPLSTGSATIFRHACRGCHKTVNVLDKVPLSVQPKMKQDLREICLAPNRAAAEAALNVFAEKYRVKYGKAVECLTKDHESLLTFYAASPVPHPQCHGLRSP